MDPAPRPAVRARPRASEIRRLDKQIATLKVDNAMLAARVKELLARQRDLTEELKRVRFLKQQQDIQIKALADAFDQRDRQQVRADLLSEQVRLLKQKLRETEDLLRRLRATRPAPTSKPKR